MDLEKRYKNMEGIEMNILQMVRIEPEWAANRIQEGERALELLRESNSAKDFNCSGCRYSFGNYPGGGSKCSGCIRVAKDNYEV